MVEVIGAIIIVAILCWLQSGRSDAGLGDYEEDMKREQRGGK